MLYQTDTQTDRRMCRASDGRGMPFPVLVLNTSAGGKLVTVVRMDGKGTGRPFVVDAVRELIAE